MGSLPEITMSNLGISQQIIVRLEMNPQWQAAPAYALGLIATVSPGASLTYSVQVTGDQKPDPNGFWNDHQDFSGITASQNGNVGYPITGYRLNVTTYSSGECSLGGCQMAIRITVMRKLLLALPFLLLPVAPAQAATNEGVPCGAAAQYNASTNGTTQLVSNTFGQKIYVCGFTFWAAGTVGVQLTYGTGTSCTGANAITPPFALAISTGITDPSPQWKGLPPVPVGNNLCIVTNAGVAVQAIVYYVVAP